MNDSSKILLSYVAVSALILFFMASGKASKEAIKEKQIEKYAEIKRDSLYKVYDYKPESYNYRFSEMNSEIYKILKNPNFKNDTVYKKSAIINLQEKYEKELESIVLKEIADAELNKLLEQRRQNLKTK